MGTEHQATLCRGARARGLGGAHSVPTSGHRARGMAVKEGEGGQWARRKENQETGKS